MIDQLRKLIARHCETLQREVRGIEQNVAAILEADEPSSDLVQQTIAKAHKLKGGSGTIGFQDISETAAGLERALKMVAQLSGPLPVEVKDEIARLFAMLADLIRTVQPEQSDLFNVQLPTDVQTPVQVEEAPVPRGPDQMRSVS
ncbi:Hpt domain-containing protein [Cohaesibacter marisflavi]|uniref:Hpt domain-containing protein n=1 Tax=Cohaesibacter marisflavi TaxID=655353 RepID=A0A1I5CLM4_9HYPH|nr:Hpt domain-containing protein [Cohaesibacter marisflavi]SFN87925.1 Hpt domain-containing protein [Cohaesibacter marisflavi]